MDRPALLDGTNPLVARRAHRRPLSPPSSYLAVAVAAPRIRQPVLGRSTTRTSPRAVTVHYLATNPNANAQRPRAASPTPNALLAPGVTLTNAQRPTPTLVPIGKANAQRPPRRPTPWNRPTPSEKNSPRARGEGEGGGGERREERGERGERKEPAGLPAEFQSRDPTPNAQRHRLRG